jgi:predicted ferric reductase
LLRTLAIVLSLATGMMLADELPRLFALWHTDAPLQWWASRATGFVAYVAMWLSMMFGLMISSRGLDGFLNRKTVLEFHQQWTLSAVLASLLHIALIIGDPYVDVGWGDALTPGGSPYLTGATALGTLALWGIALLTVSSWLQRRIGHRTWRLIHTSALGSFVLGLAHGVIAGTDSGALAAQATYAGTAAVLLGAIVFRALYIPQKAKARPAAANEARPLASTKAA